MLTFLLRERRHAAAAARRSIARAMASDPAARYADARELADDVLRFSRQEPVSAYRENVRSAPAAGSTRHRALVTLMAAYIVMRVIVFFWMRL